MANAAQIKKQGGTSNCLNSRRICAEEREDEIDFMDGVGWEFGQGRKFPMSFRESNARVLQGLQGNLQYVFDALYELGVIDPVLKADWSQHLEAIEQNSFKVRRAVEIVNGCGDDRQKLFNELGRMDPSTLELLAVEVAREYAGFHTRSVVH